MRQRLVSFILAATAFFPLTAQATWSVIALDMASGKVVIASATCVAQERLEQFPALDLRDVQAIVVPGLGIAAAQAAVDRSRKNQQLIFSEIKKPFFMCDIAYYFLCGVK